MNGPKIEAQAREMVSGVKLLLDALKSPRNHSGALSPSKEEGRL